MMTPVEKNLTIASMESALDYARKQAGLTTLATLEHLIGQLRSLYQRDPDQVSEYMIKIAAEMFERAQPPSLRNIRRIFYQLRDATFTPLPATGGTGLFDGSFTFDGSQTFDGSASVSGQFDGSTTFDGSQQFDGGSSV